MNLVCIPSQQDQELEEFVSHVKIFSVKFALKMILPFAINVLKEHWQGMVLANFVHLTVLIVIYGAWHPIGHALSVMMATS